jgi:hypothetical protein
MFSTIGDSQGTNAGRYRIGERVKAGSRWYPHKNKHQETHE